MKKTPYSPLLTALLLIALTLLTGCETTAYYRQSIEGHLALLAKREPIEKLLASDELSEKRREQLTAALEIRDYASDTLALPRNDSYREFVELGRPAVVWNVVATPEFSLRPEQWCFLVVGCMTYRGYFAKEDAESYAEALAQTGLDVTVGGASAYSTLGWFSDPLLSTMVDRGQILMAEVIFHELSHQLLYIKNDTTFNEAFASAVAEHGVRRWLADHKPEDLPKYEQWLERKGHFLQLLRQTSDALRTLYASELDDDEMRSGKQALFNTLIERYAELKEKWNGYDGYDGWFEKPINNARLTSIGVYRDRVPDFMRWLEACGNDLPQFYDTMRRLSKLDKPERHRRLRGEARCSS